jgi:hypothetical protein
MPGTPWFQIFQFLLSHVAGVACTTTFSYWLRWGLMSRLTLNCDLPE